MSGIVFFRTQKLEMIKAFYINTVGAQVWMDQGDCVILRFGGHFLFGFCQRDHTDTDALLTFFYKTPQEVDEMYDLLRDQALAAPQKNPQRPIYNFFAKDPENREIEFQYFTEPIDWEF